MNKLFNKCGEVNAWIWSNPISTVQVLWVEKIGPGKSNAVVSVNNQPVDYKLIDFANGRIELLHFVPIQVLSGRKWWQFWKPKHKIEFKHIFQ